MVDRQRMGVGGEEAACAILPDPAIGEQPSAMDRRRLAGSMARRGRWLSREPGIIGAAARMLAERTLEIRFAPDSVLDLGCRTGLMPSLVRERWPAVPVFSLVPPGVAGVAPAVVGDLLRLPFAGGSFALVLSNLALQWSGQLPLALREVRRVMKADGLLLCTVPGDDNLWELRECLAAVDGRRYGRSWPRVMAGYAIHYFGDALQGAGFAFPVADRERATLTFENMAALLRMLRRMGAVNPFMAPAMDGEYLRELEGVYRQRFVREGKLVLTVDILFGHGWKQPVKK